MYECLYSSTQPEFSQTSFLVIFNSSFHYYFPGLLKDLQRILRHSNLDVWNPQLIVFYLIMFLLHIIKPFKIFFGIRIPRRFSDAGNTRKLRDSTTVCHLFFCPPLVHFLFYFFACFLRTLNTIVRYSMFLCLCIVVETLLFYVSPICGIFDIFHRII